MTGNVHMIQIVNPMIINVSTKKQPIKKLKMANMEPKNTTTIMMTVSMTELVPYLIVVDVVISCLNLFTMTILGPDFESVILYNSFSKCCHIL